MNAKRLCVVLLLVMVIPIPGYCLAAAKKPSSLAELALYNGSDRQQILEEGAKKEGRLVFYSSGTNAVNAVVEAFQKKYPLIKVDLWRAPSMVLTSRTTEEFRAGKHTVDVIEGTQSNMLLIQQLGLVQPFLLPNLAQIEDDAKTNAPAGGVWAVAFRSSGIGFGYNTKMLSKNQLPKTYQDLTDPKWKGKLAIAGTDTGVNWAGAIYRNYGLDLLKKIAAQNFVIQMISGTAVGELVAAGEYEATPAVTDANVFAAKLSGAPIAWTPLEPVRVLAGYITVTKHAPHPHAALLFADFEITREVGEIHRGLGYDSFRKDVPAVEQRYKRYFGVDTVEGVKEDFDLFSNLFLKK